MPVGAYSGVIGRDGRMIVDVMSGIVRGDVRLKAATYSSDTTVGNNINAVLLNNTAAGVDLTLPAPLDPIAHGLRLLVVFNVDVGGTAHTVATPSGVTFDGTNDLATFATDGQFLVLANVSATRWAVLLNGGTVVLSESA